MVIQFTEAYSQYKLSGVVPEKSLLKQVGALAAAVVSVPYNWSGLSSEQSECSAQQAAMLTAQPIAREGAAQWTALGSQAQGKALLAVNQVTALPTLDSFCPFRTSKGAYNKDYTEPAFFFKSQLMLIVQSKGFITAFPYMNMCFDHVHPITFFTPLLLSFHIPNSLSYFQSPTPFHI